MNLTYIPRRVLPLVSLLFVLFLPLPIHSDWYSTPVIMNEDGIAQNPVENTPLLVDSANRIHVAYFKFNQSPEVLLRYAIFDGINWSVRTADSGMSPDSQFVVGIVSLVLDSSGNPNMAYVDAGTKRIKYAYWTGASWSTQTITTASSVPQYISLGISKTGQRYVTYQVPGDGLKYAIWNGSSWSLGTVESGSAIGQDVSLSVDSSGLPHISYYDGTASVGDLKYASWTGSSWSISAVDSLGDVGASSCLQLTTSNQPRISYIDKTNAALKFASWNGSQWVKETILTGINFGYVTLTSLALNSSQNPVILYANSEYVSYTTKESGTWTNSIGNRDSYVNLRKPSMALSPNGQVNYVSDGLSVWTFGAPNPPPFAEAINPQNNQITWHWKDNSQSELGYRIRASSSGAVLSPDLPPNTETWDQTGLTPGATYQVYVEVFNQWGSNGVFSYPAQVSILRPVLKITGQSGDKVFLDWSGSANANGINYRVERSLDGYSNFFECFAGKVTSGFCSGHSAGNTYYYRVGAENTSGTIVTYSTTVAVTPLSSEQWAYEIFAQGSSPGTSYSSAIDSAGRLHVSFYDQSTGDLMYAVRSSIAWDISTVDSQDDVGMYNSLALDSQGNPNISYYDKTNNRLKFAHRLGKVWEIQTVDTSGGENTSLALDKSNRPHIAYHDRSDQSLRYATSNGSSWTHETIEVYNYINEHGSYLPAIAVDSSGEVHIAFTITEPQFLKYTTRSNGVWPIESIGFTGTPGVSLTLNSLGEPNLVYLDPSPSPQAWMLSRKRANTWETIKIENAWNYKYAPSCAFDSSGILHIALFNNGGKYMEWDGTSWSKQPFNFSGVPSMIMDSDGNPHVIYFDSNYQGLLHLKRGRLANDLLVSVPISQAGQSIFASGPAGDISLDIPQYAFKENLWMTIKTPNSVPEGKAVVKLIKLPTAYEINLDKSVQPSREVQMMLSYREADVAGLDESQLTIARFDDQTGSWTILPSVVDSVHNRVTAKTTHFSLFELAQIDQSTDLSSAKVYPNPFRPAHSSQPMTITGMPANADISIYSFDGHVVKRLSSDSGGQATWDGRSDDGNNVGSGVYLILIKGGSSHMVIKAAIQR